MKRLILLTILVTLILGSCKTTEQTGRPAEKVEKPPQETTEVKVEESEPVREIEKYRYHFFDGYQESHTRKFDLLHTELHVSFDWEKEHLLGKAKLTLKPYFYPQDELELDAKHYDIHAVGLMNGEEKTPLRYTYDTMKLNIQLPREYTREEEIEVYIDYTAKPNESRDGGSSAIQRGQGLYFINADGSEEGKPRQIWTQGEPESNSHWFPTIDKPNERTTQDIFITVNDSLTTLSNGAFMASERNDDGTRTDHWQMDQPHAPYLFMMAIGEYVITEDEWRGMPVHYYMEPKYAANAQRIFGNTPEMLEYYSNVLGVKYPWSKYHQVVVRDFVSGAMENTTATIYYSGLNMTRSELVDDDQDDIIAHELFHQWFGDLVTTESWANIPLNEAFATYGEILWREHSGGLDAADAQRLNDLRIYLMTGSQVPVPMIRYYHNKPGDMFDPNSYQRGGATLGMLREYVGDEAFFESLKLYLTEHKFQAVELDDLRLAFEEVTGEDLHWFFDQWFMMPGYPEMEMKVSFDTASNKHKLNLSQTQSYDSVFVFRLPVKVQLYKDGKASEQEVWLTSRDSTYYFPSEIDMVIPDEAYMMVGEVDKQYPFHYYYDLVKPEVRLKTRAVALDSLEDHQESDAKAYTAVTRALDDPYYLIRSKALKIWEPKPEDYPMLRNLALNDPHPDVRSAAVNKIRSEGDTSNYKVFYTAINDSSMKVASAALFILYDVDPKTAVKNAKNFENSNDGNLLTTVAEIYANSPKPEYLAFYQKTLKKDIGWAKYIIMNRFADFLSEVGDEETVREGVATLEKVVRAADPREGYIAFRTMRKVRDRLREQSEMEMPESEREQLTSLADDIHSILEELYSETENESIKKSGLD